MAQEVCIPLAKVGKVLATLPADHIPNRADRAEISRRWADDLDRRIHRLEQLRGGLAGCIGCGCLSLEQCQRFNRDDRLAAEGPGHSGLMGD